LLARLSAALNLHRRQAVPSPRPAPDAWDRHAARGYFGIGD
jgi:hypothetical protein